MHAYEKCGAPAFGVAGTKGKSFQIALAPRKNRPSAMFQCHSCAGQPLCIEHNGLRDMEFEPSQSSIVGKLFRARVSGLANDGSSASSNQNRIVRRTSQHNGTELSPGCHIDGR